jgi:flagellar basal-body rod modification protein FlgD
MSTTSSGTSTGPVATLPPGQAVATTTNSAAGPSSASFSSINSQTFLQLLVAQLKYQDPSNPTDSTQFLAQTASFEEVEQLQTMASSIAGLVSAQQAGTASNYLGRQVTGTDTSGKPLSGIVTGVQLSSGGPVLSIGPNGASMNLSSVTSVAAATSTPDATAPTAAATGSTTTTGTTTGSAGTPSGGDAGSSGAGTTAGAGPSGGAGATNTAAALQQLLSS